MKQYAALDDTVYFWFAANDTSGSGGDGASPAADVRLAGAAVDAAPVYSPTPALLSHVSYPAGAYEIAIAATAANGFAANNTYAIFCTLAIDAQNPTGFVGSFDLKPVEANVTQIGDAVQSATDLKDFADAGYDPDTNKLVGLDASFNTVIADTDELQTDWADGGRLDLLLDAKPTKTEQDASFNTVITDLDNPDQYKADVSALPTKTEQDTSFNTVITDVGVIATKAEADASFNQIADNVWDEILTGATHNVATSAGKRLREIAAYTIHSGTAQAGTSTTITLAASANGGDGIFNRDLIVIVGGTGAGQTRTIADYNNTTKVCIIDREWRINPDNTSEYQVLADDTPLVVDQGIAQAGTATTITLRDYASSTNNAYLCNIVAIIGGTGRGQARLVGSYNGTTKVVTLCGDNWVTNPDSTSVYVMVPYGTTCTSCVGTTALTQIADATLDEVVEGSLTFRQMLRLFTSVLAGKSAGGGTVTLTFRDNADGKDRITATVDASGNRTAITLDGA